MNLKQKRIISIAVLVLFAVAMVILFWLIGKPLVRLVSDPAQFQQWVNEKGVWAPLAFAVMVALQVVVAIIPGEAFEIAAGFSFGTLEGTLYCLLGTMLGSLIIFLMVRKWGIKLVELFFSLDKINSLSFLKDNRKRNTLTFLLMMLPGTPKDLLTYLAGLTKIKLYEWLIISTVARIPSVISSVIGGSYLAEKNYTATIIVFSVTMVLSLTGLLLYNLIVKHQQKKAK